jgi:hypothetical protein
LTEDRPKIGQKLPILGEKQAKKMTIFGGKIAYFRRNF